MNLCRAVSSLSEASSRPPPCGCVLTFRKTWHNKLLVLLEERSSRACIWSVSACLGTFLRLLVPSGLPKDGNLQVFACDMFVVIVLPVFVILRPCKCGPSEPKYANVLQCRDAKCFDSAVRCCEEQLRGSGTDIPARTCSRTLRHVSSLNETAGKKLRASFP